VSAAVREEDGELIAGTGVITLRILDRQNIDPGFLSCAVGAPDSIMWLKHHAIGATMPNLNSSVILSLPIRLPDLQTQRSIAHILGTLDDKIGLNRRINETLEAIARALFKSWFVDFDPVRAKAEGRDPGMPKHIADLFPDRFEHSELGEIPAGWYVSELPQEIDFLEGPGLRNWQYRDEGMKFLNIRCIDNGDLDVSKANAISLEEFAQTYKHFALCEDDIVISTSGALGRLAIVRSDHLPVMLNTSIIRMRGRSPVSLAYVWAFLQSEYFLEEMFALAAGSVQLNFGPMHLKKISMLRPSNAVLSYFEDAAQPVIRRVLENRKESRTLSGLRDTLLPKLISGELRMKNDDVRASA
jgi:type I restriction enzyme, S subunit